MGHGRWIYEAPGLRHLLAEAQLDGIWQLSDRHLGEAITDHRSSWVRLINVSTRRLYVKTYDYPTWRDRSRGIGRTTLFASSRAKRETTALSWLREHGFGGPEPLGLVETRTLGILRRSVLVTAAWPGRRLDRLLPQLNATDQRLLLSSLADFVRRLHQAGFRDGNLDLRNLLGSQEQGHWTIAKIDSPKYRLVRSGTADRRAQKDWLRLTGSLEALGLSDELRSLLRP